MAYIPITTKQEQKRGYIPIGEGKSTPTAVSASTSSWRAPMVLPSAQVSAPPLPMTKKLKVLPTIKRVGEAVKTEVPKLFRDISTALEKITAIPSRADVLASVRDKKIAQQQAGKPLQTFIGRPQSGATTDILETITPEEKIAVQAEEAGRGFVRIGNKGFDPTLGGLKRTIGEEIATPVASRISNIIKNTVMPLVEGYRSVPRGVPIKSPQETFLIGTIRKDISEKFNISEDAIISRMSLKHITEQRGENAIEIIESIPEVLSSPTKIADNSSKRPNSYLFARMNGKAKGVVLEVTKTPDANRVVSAYSIDRKTYEKLTDISGRPDVPPLDISPVESEISTAQKLVLSPDGTPLGPKDFLGAPSAQGGFEEVLGRTDGKKSVLPPLPKVNGVRDYSFKDSFGGKLHATIKDGTANIYSANAPEKGHGLYENAIKDLGARGIGEVEVTLQSVDSINALRRLVEKGYLKNPRGGDSRIVGGVPRVFDIVNAKTKSQLTDIWNEANKNVSPSPISAREKLITGAQKPPFQYKQLEDLAEKIKNSDVTERRYSELQTELQVLEEQIDEMPGKKLTKYISRKEGQFVDLADPLSAKTQSQQATIFARNQKVTKAAESAFQGTKYSDTFDDPDTIRTSINEYINARNKVQKIREVMGKIRPEISAVRKGERLMTLTKGDRRREFRTLKERYTLSDAELNRIRSGRNVVDMSREDFSDFMRKAETFAGQIEKRREAQIQLGATISEKELRKTDNLRKAMKLPKIENMTAEQMNKLNSVLEEYRHGDEFLGPRQLQTVENTDLSGIRTLREARERLAKQTGVNISDLNNIKVSELDRFRYDTSLARRNPFYSLMVDETNKAVLNGEAQFLDLKREINNLINGARASRPRGVMEKMVPTDKHIFDWLSADDIGKVTLAREMTEEELHAGNKIRELFAGARDYLVQHEVLKRYIGDYITHIRRGFLEAWKDDGLLNAFKEAFKAYKQDEAYFNILDQQTGEVLPLEKFFQFSMHRSGELVPTKNVAAAVQAYFRAFYKKQALDSIVPKLDIYAHSLSPKKLTPRGLEFDTSLKRFVKEWINTKKGRVIDMGIIKPGGSIDWALRTGVAFTRLLDLGLNIPIGMASTVGEQVTTFTSLGMKNYTSGIRRLASRQGKMITSKYENFVGEKLLDLLSDAAQGAGDKIMTGMFSLFRAASRRANQIFLLGSMTEGEFLRGSISPERLAELKRIAGRYRAMEGAESILGKTSPGLVFSQYKKWAVPILSTTVDNLTQVSKSLKKNGISALKDPEAQELLRASLLTGTVALGVYGYGYKSLGNKKDRNFVEDMVYKSSRESLTLISALDPSFWFAEPRMQKFLGDLSTNISQIVKFEKNKDGELKGLSQLGKAVTPQSVKQLSREVSTTETTSSGGGLPKLPKLPTLPSIPKLPRL